jgi:hypothetical protein
MKTNKPYTHKVQYKPVYTSVHPRAGFIAWPEKEPVSQEEKEKLERIKRRRERRGFIAWPQQVKE